MRTLNSTTMSLILHSPDFSSVISSLHVEPHRRNFVNTNYKGFQKLAIEIGRVRVCCSSLKELKKVGVVDLSDKLDRMPLVAPCTLSCVALGEFKFALL